MLQTDLTDVNESLNRPPKLSNLKTVFDTMRPPFLMLTVSIMLLLLAVSVRYAEETHSTISFALYGLIVLGALAAHISVNMLNEYEDFYSGLDAMTDRTPFSGGSGALFKEPRVAELVAGVGYFWLGLVISLGVFFIYLRGWGLLPIGLVGVFIIVFYTSLLTRLPWLCFLSSGIGFGPLMMVGGYFVLTGEYSVPVLAISMIPFLLVNNLLLLNQVPDFKADAQVGRTNLLHRYGIETGLKIFLLQGVLVFIALTGLILFGVLPLGASLGFLLLLLFLPMALKVKYLLKTFPLLPKVDLKTVMGMNVGFTILMPILIAVGLYLSML